MKNKIKFYLDEHIANAIADGLHRRGIDVLTIVVGPKMKNIMLSLNRKAA